MEIIIWSKFDMNITLEKILGFTGLFWLQNFFRRAKDNHWENNSGKPNYKTGIYFYNFCTNTKKWYLFLIIMIILIKSYIRGTNWENCLCLLQHKTFLKYTNFMKFDIHGTKQNVYPKKITCVLHINNIKSWRHKFI